MMLLDSPLNKAGKLQVYIRTKKNVLIEVLYSFSEHFRSIIHLILFRRLTHKREYLEHTNDLLVLWVKSKENFGCRCI